MAMTIAKANDWQGVKPHKITIALAVVVSVISFIALITWYLDAEGAVFWFQPAPMNPLVAILFLANAGLIITLIANPRTLRYTQIVFAIILLSLTYVLIDKIYSLPVHIDQLYFYQKTIGGNSNSGRGMSITTSVLMMLVSGSLFLSVSKLVRENVNQTIETCIFFFSLFILVAYLYRIPERPHYFLMAPLTAFNFAMLSTALLLFHLEKGFVKEFVLGAFARSTSVLLLPLAIIFPITLGYFRLYGEWLHLVSTELGVAFLICTFVMISTGATWIVARSYNRRIAIAEENQLQAQRLATSNEEMHALAEELRATNEALLSNINALARANATIEKQKDEILNRVLDSSHEVIWSFDLTGKGENYLSRSAEKIYDEPYEKLLTEPSFWLEHVLDEDKPLKTASQADLYKTGRASCIYRLRTNGEVRWFRDELRLIKDESGVPTRLEGVATDITDFHMKEVEILRERNLLRALIDNIPSFIFLRDINLKTILSNRATFELLGASNEQQVVGRDLIDYFGETARDLYEEERKVLATGIPLINREVKVNSKGKDVLLSTSKIPLKDENGNVIQILGISHDITDLRRAENELMRYRQHLEIIFNNSSDTFVLLDPDAKILQYNKQFEAYMQQYPRVKYGIGLSLFDVIAPNRNEVVKEILQRVRAGERVGVISESEFEHITKYYKVIYTPVFDNGVLAYITISSTDITEQKLQDIALANSAANLRSVMESTVDNVLMTDGNFRLIVANDNYRRYVREYRRKEVAVGDNVLSLAPEENRAAIKSIFERARFEKVVNFQISPDPHGDKKIWDVAITPVFVGDRFSGYCVVQRDITQELRQREILEQYRQHLEIVFQNTNDIFVLFDAEARLVLFNEVYRRFIEKLKGFTPQAGMKWSDVLPEDRLEPSKSILEKIRRGESVDEIAKTTAGNSAIYFSLRFRPVLIDGKVRFFTLSAFDITEQKNRELEIEGYRQNLEIIFKNSADNFVLIDREAKIILFNESFRRFPQEMRGIIPEVGMSVYDVLPTDRIEPSKEIFQKVLKGESIDVVAKTMAIGSPRYFSVRYRPVQTGNEVKFISISAFDVTEKVNQEKLVQESAQFSRELLDSMNLHIAVIGPQGEIIATNRAWDNFGRLNGESRMSRISVGSNYFSVCKKAIAGGDEVAKEALDGIHGVLSKQKENFEIEYPCDSPSEKRWFQLRVMPFQEDRIITLHYDITHRKQIENELKQDQYFLDKASESAKIGYWTSEPVGKNGKLTWSKEVFKIFGIREEQFLGINQCFFDKVHPEDRERVAEVTRQALEQGTVYHVDHRIVMPDGSARWVNEKAQVLRNEKGNASLMVGIVQDINDRKITEQVLREYNERFEILSRATNDAIWDFDIEKDTVTWNHGLMSIFGYDLRRVKDVSRWWSQKIHPDDHDRVLQEMSTVFGKRSTNWTTEYRYLCADGSYKSVLDRAYVIYSDKKPVRMIGAMQDVSEVVEYRQNLEGIIRERTEKLNQSLAKEKDLVDLKSRFISIASHEFRTPLATISLSAGFLNRYSGKISAGQIAKKAAGIELQVQHMKEMLEDVLFVGKADEGKIKVELTETPIGIFEKLAIEALHSRGNTHHLELSVNIKTKTFTSDQKLLRNIVFNLVTNAVKFSPEANKIYLTVREERNHLLVSVRDEGIGIPANEIKNLFSSFARASNASRIEGTGLGLHIIQRAVELLKGTIKVRSLVGKGTEFKLRLPMLAGS